MSSLRVWRTCEKATDAAVMGSSRSTGLATLGSGTVLNVHCAHPSHHNPTDATASLVTRSTWSLSENASIAARCIASSSPPPTYPYAYPRLLILSRSPGSPMCGSSEL